MTDPRLQQLAELAGLAVDWIDANGRAQRVSDPALQRVLAGLGHPADSVEAIEASIQALLSAHDARHLPPLLTVDQHQPLELAGYFPASMPCRVLLEDGSEQQLQLDDQAGLPVACLSAITRCRSTSSTSPWP